MKDLSTCREEINRIDDEMKKLFIERMEIVADVAKYKKENNLPIFDAKREASMKDRLSSDLDILKPYYLNFLEVMLKESKEYQKEMLGIK